MTGENRMVRLYDRFTPKERLLLFLEAVEREDHWELARLSHTCPTVKCRTRDPRFTDLVRARGDVARVIIGMWFANCAEVRLAEARLKSIKVLHAYGEQIQGLLRQGHDEEMEFLDRVMTESGQRGYVRGRSHQRMETEEQAYLLGFRFGYANPEMSITQPAGGEADLVEVSFLAGIGPGQEAARGGHPCDPAEPWIEDPVDEDDGVEDPSAPERVAEEDDRHETGEDETEPEVGGDDEADGSTRPSKPNAALAAGEAEFRRARAVQDGMLDGIRRFCKTVGIKPQLMLAGLGPLAEELGRPEEEPKAASPEGGNGTGRARAEAAEQILNLLKTIWPAHGEAELP